MNTNSNIDWNNTNEQIIKSLFQLYYSALISFASNIIQDNQASQDFVQEVFAKLWENPRNFSSEKAAKSYLYTSVKNKCLNYLEHNKVAQKYQKYSAKELLHSPDISDLIIEEETYRLIYNSINELPPQCRKVLLLSINGSKNDEIAEELAISVNSVKTQKKLAYKQMRIKLKDVYLILGALIQSSI